MLIRRYSLENSIATFLLLERWLLMVHWHATLDFFFSALRRNPISHTSLVLFRAHAKQVQETSEFWSKIKPSLLAVSLQKLASNDLEGGHDIPISRARQICTSLTLSGPAPCPGPLSRVGSSKHFQNNDEVAWPRPWISNSFSYLKKKHLKQMLKGYVN